MTNNLAFYIVDVFAEERFAGNQLAVFRGNPTTDIMQKIAKEMNYAETTFITSEQPRDGGYDVRIFTPASELPFAGHPTLGTASVIRRELQPLPGDTVTLNLKVGQIPVTFADDGYVWMRQKPPQFGHVYSAAQIAEVLGLQVEAVDTRFPVQEVSTGLAFIMVPLKTLAAVKDAEVRVDKLKAMIAQPTPLQANALFVFSPEAYHKENHLNARCFVHLHGIPEDPATGSANGNLAGYLVKYRYFGTEAIDVRVEQGYEIGRPSLLLLRASERGDSIEVNVGGRVVMVAKGQLSD